MNTISTMDVLQSFALPIIVTLLGSGVWTFLIEWVKLKNDKCTAERKMLLGLGHDVLYQRLTFYLERGYIEPEELENVEYVFRPYVGLGGNGTCAVLYEEVCKLPKKNPKETGDK